MTASFIGLVNFIAPAAVAVACLVAGWQARGAYHRAQDRKKARDSLERLRTYFGEPVQPPQARSYSLTRCGMGAIEAEVRRRYYNRAMGRHLADPARVPHPETAGSRDHEVPHIAPSGTSDGGYVCHMCPPVLAYGYGPTPAKAWERFAVAALSDDELTARARRQR